MADAATALNDGLVATKKPRNSRKALKEKNPSAIEVNIVPTKVSEPVSVNEPEKENHESLSQPRSSPKKGRGAASKKQSKQSSFEKDLEEMQAKLQQLQIEKEKTEELLKSKDDMLKLKEEELENRGREHEKLQIEVKKLQKLKEFKPTMVSFNKI